MLPSKQGFGDECRERPGLSTILVLEGEQEVSSAAKDEDISKLGKAD
jgi:hypothetical protein